MDWSDREACQSAARDMCESCTTVVTSAGGETKDSKVEVGVSAEFMSNALIYCWRLRKYEILTFELIAKSLLSFCMFIVITMFGAR